MATGVLALVGNAILPGIGGIIGAVVGSYIDNKIIFKQRSGTREAFIPETQSASEGGPALYLIGQHCRVKGQIIWMSDIHLLNNVQVCSIAIAIARNEIFEVHSVFAEGFDIYNGAGTASVKLANNFAITHRKITIDQPLGPITLYWEATITSLDIKGFAPFRRGVYRTLTMLGWADAGNNWGSGGGIAGNSKGTVHSIKAAAPPSNINIMRARRENSKKTPLPNVNEAVNANKITITQSFTPVNPEFSTGFTLHKGTPGQAKSSEILSFEPDEETPAYEQTAYFTVQNLKLTQFGNRVPELIAIAGQTSTARTLPQAIGDIMAIGGWDVVDELRYDTAKLDAADIVRGYTMQGSLSIAQRLEPLMIAFDIWAQMRDGLLVFFYSKNAREFSVPESAWGASMDGDSPGLLFSGRSTLQLPSVVTVHFVDHITYEDASVHENQSASLVVSPDELVVDLRSMTLSETEAKAIAYRLLWRPMLESEDVVGTLPPSYYHLLENDLISTTFEGESIRILLTKVGTTETDEIIINGYVWMPDPGITR